MNWWQALVLGVVQGLTEFLPVSSDGHLALAQQLMGIRTPGVVVEVTVHVATLAAVVIVYWQKITELTRGLVGGSPGARREFLLLVLATIPAGLAGVFLKDWVARTYNSLWIIGVGFLVTGTVLWSTRRRAAMSSNPDIDARRAGGMGVAQAFAILPGVSRSGSTVAAGMWSGLDPIRAAEFSFLMAIPVILGAAVLEAPEILREEVAVGRVPLLLSFAAAMVSGIFAIRFLVALLRRRAFHRFAIYCWALGLAVLVVWLKR